MKLNKCCFINNNYLKYELQFDLARDVGLDYAPRQLFSSISF
jgi:hypothetical protein